MTTAQPDNTPAATTQRHTDAPRYSVVVPAYNEDESLPELHEQVTAELDKLGETYEIIFVDDGSTDATPRVLDDLATQHTQVTAIHLGSNRGKSAAYTAAFEQVRGNIVITLDADLQDKPAELPKLLAKLGSGYDLVVGWKQGRATNEPTKAFPSRCYNALKGWLFGLRLHDSNCGFRAMRREVAQSIPLYGDLYRFLPELAHRAGFRVTETPVGHAARKYGRSKYGPARFWTGLLDLIAVWFITGFMHKPLQFFGTLGLMPLVLGVALEIYVLIYKLAGSPFQQHIAAIVIGVMLILLAFQMFGIGLVGEMLRYLWQPRAQNRPHTRRSA